MADKSSDFPLTGTVHDLATSHIVGAARRTEITTEAPDSHESALDEHISGLAGLGGATHPSPTIASERTPVGPVREPTPPGEGPPHRGPIPPVRGGGGGDPPERHPVKPRPPRGNNPHPGHGHQPVHRPDPPHKRKPEPDRHGAPREHEDFVFVDAGGRGGGEGQQANQQTQQQSSGLNPLVIVLILGAIGVAAYLFYMHEKKGDGSHAHHEASKHEEKHEEKKAE